MKKREANAGRQLTGDQMRKAAVRMTMLVTAGAGLLMTVLSGALIHRDVQRRLVDTANRGFSVYRERERSVLRFYSSRIEGFISTNPRICRAIEQKQTDCLQALVRPKFETLRAENTHFVEMGFYDRHGQALHRVTASDALERTIPCCPGVVGAALDQHRTVAGYGLTPGGGVALAVSAPVGERSALHGVAEFVVDVGVLAAAVRRATGAGFVVVDRFGTPLAGAAEALSFIPERTLRDLTRRRGSRTAVGLPARHRGRWRAPLLVADLTGVDGGTVGFAVFFLDVTEEVRTVSSYLLVLAGAGTVLLVAIGVIVNRYSSELVGRLRTLRGLLPICARCKRVRDDAGYWQQVEAYISHHSEADFSHGICPSCAAELYPEYMDEEDIDGGSRGPSGGDQER